MYTWGISIERVKEIWPKAIDLTYTLKLHCLIMSNFPSDCGALILEGCNTATYPEIKAAQEIASLSGHSKLFGTIVMKDKQQAERQAALFKKAGFRIIKRTTSNRNTSKTDIVLFYHNPNCIKTGY